MSVRISERAVARMPSVGLGMASHGRPLDDREAELLRALGPAHVRADVRPAAAGWADDLALGQDTARRLGCALEPAVIGPVAGAGAELERRLAEGPPLARVLGLGEGQDVTSTAWLDDVRGAVGEPGRDVRFAAGSNAYFTELNRSWELVQGAPAVAYPVTPQVHAFDDRSLMETLPMQAITVRTARARAPGSAVVVGPITLRPRSNPLATGDGGGDGVAGELPPGIDERQMSLFAGAWTLGSLAALAGAGVEACTYFETTGWRGVVERATGPPLPHRFPSRAGMAFPVFQVLADACAGPGWDVLAVGVAENDPPRVAALALRGAGRMRLLLANLTPEAATVDIAGLPDTPAATRTLDEDAAAALVDPLAFRARTHPTAVPDGRLVAELRPYACRTLEWGA